MSLFKTASKLLFLVLLLLTAACASGRGGDEGSQRLRVPAQHASRGYTNALETWGRVYATSRNEADLAAGIRRVIKKLEDAAVVSPSNPLLQSKIGDLHMDLDETGPALAAYKRSIDCCPDWAPGWLGLARCAIAENRKDLAERSLEAVTWSLENIRTWGEPEPPGFFEGLLSAFGIEIPQEPRRRAVDDPALDPAQARAVVRSWLAESLAWSPANGAILGGTPASQGGDIEHRIAARARFLEAAMILGGLRGDVDSREKAALEACRQALDLDPDYFDARTCAAEIHLGLGNPRVARAYIEPYVADNNPILANHSRLLELLARAYTASYLAEPSRDTLADSARLFRWIRDQGRKLESPFWKLVQQWFIAREAADRTRLEKIGGQLERVRADNLEHEAYRKGLLADLVRARNETRVSGAGRHRMK